MQLQSATMSTGRRGPQLRERQREREREPRPADQLPECMVPSGEAFLSTADVRLSPEVLSFSQYMVRRCKLVQEALLVRQAGQKEHVGQKRTRCRTEGGADGPSAPLLDFSTSPACLAASRFALQVFAGVQIASLDDDGASPAACLCWGEKCNTRAAVALWLCRALRLLQGCCISALLPPLHAACYRALNLSCRCCC